VFVDTNVKKHNFENNKTSKYVILLYTIGPTCTYVCCVRWRDRYVTKSGCQCDVVESTKVESKSEFESWWSKSESLGVDSKSNDYESSPSASQVTDSRCSYYFTSSLTPEDESVSKELILL